MISSSAGDWPQQNWRVYSGTCLSRGNRTETIILSESTMAIADLKSVLKIFGGSDVSDADRSELYKEVLLMTLSRAADADINIQKAEIDRIREILKQHTGEDFSAGDIRMAARAELYAESTLRKYLKAVREKMANADRVDTVHALADVFRSDQEISVLEIDFFNRVAVALEVTPAEIAGLVAGEVS